MGSDSALSIWLFYPQNIFHMQGRIQTTASTAEAVVNVSDPCFYENENINQSAVCLNTQSHHSYGKYHTSTDLENFVKVLQIIVVYVAFVLCCNPSWFRYCTHTCRTQQCIELNVKESF